MQNWNGQFFFFFQKQAGYVMRRIRRETLQIEGWISFQSVHPLQLMHLFLYAPSASENWIMDVFWNVLLFPIWEWYIYVLPLTKNIFSLCHRSFFVHTLQYFDGQLKSQLSSHQPLILHLCSPLHWACIIKTNRYRGQAIADMGVPVMLMKTTVQSLQKDIHLRNNLWMCYRIGHDRFFYYYYYCCCIYVFGRCKDAFYQSWRSKPWPWEHYSSWAPWIVKW